MDLLQQLDGLADAEKGKMSLKARPKGLTPRESTSTVASPLIPRSSVPSSEDIVYAGRVKSKEKKPEDKLDKLYEEKRQSAPAQQQQQQAQQQQQQHQQQQQQPGTGAAAAAAAAGNANQNQISPVKQDSVEIQNLRTRIAELSRQYEKLHFEHNSLKLRAETGNMEQSQVVKFLESKVQDLEKKIRDMEKDQAQADKNREYEEMMWHDKVQNLEGTLREKEREIAKYKDNEIGELEFRKEQVRMATEKDSLMKKMEAMKEQYAQELADKERQKDIEKARIIAANQDAMKELRVQIEQDRLKWLDEAHVAIANDNIRLAKDFQAQVQRNDKMRQEKEVMEGHLRAAAREIGLLKDSSTEMAKQLAAGTKERRAQALQLREMERALSNAVGEFETERTRLTVSYEKRIGDLSLELTQTKNLLGLKSKELAYIRQLSKTILESRSEIERYLLESIADVKADIAQNDFVRNQNNNNQSKASSTRPGANAAAGGGGGGAGGGVSSLTTMAQQPAVARLDLQDLNLADRERILRLLFSKINNAKPSHAGVAGGGGAGAKLSVSFPDNPKLVAEDIANTSEDNGDGNLFGLQGLGSRPDFA